MEKNARQLHAKLTEIKNELKNETRKRKSTYYEVQSLLVDFMNENQERRLEDLSYKFFDEDLLEEYVKARFDKWGTSEVIKQLQGISTDAELFYLDGYENLQQADEDDILDRIDDIIREIENH